MDATGNQIRRAWMCAGLCLLATTDLVAQVPGRYGVATAAPSSFLQELVAERLRVAPFASPLGGDADIEEKALLDPGHIYSAPRPFDDTIVDEAWERALARLHRKGIDITPRQAHDDYLRELGLTRARPGSDVRRSTAMQAVLGTPAMLNLVKAGIDMDIAVQARELAGPENAMVAAPLAVAAQLLREQVAEAHASGESAWTGVWAAPLERFLGARSADGLGEEHLSYLMRLLENQLSSWRERAVSSHGGRQAPVMARVARVAAAYRSLQYAVPACLSDGSADLQVASLTLSDALRPLCFSDMTDRRVLGWYLPELFDEVREHEADEAYPAGGMQRLLDAVSRLQPAWTGIFVSHAQHSALDARVVASGAAHELLARGETSAASVQPVDEAAHEAMCQGDAP